MSHSVMCRDVINIALAHLNMRRMQQVGQVGYHHKHIQGEG